MSVAGDAAWPLSLVERLFRGLDARAVTWALLRGRADLGDAARDVDLLVEPAHVPLLEEVVVELGGVRLPRWLQGRHRFYWFPGRLGRPGLMVDVVTRLTYGRDGTWPTDLARGCLERRVRVGWAYELEPEDAFWTILLHSILDKDAVNERRARDLRAVLPARLRLTAAAAVVDDLCPPGWSPQRLLECVRHEDWGVIAELSRSVRQGAARGQHAGAGAQPTAGRRRQLLGTARRHLPRRDSVAGDLAKAAYAVSWRTARHLKGRPMTGQARPVRMSLSGLDGSGKSRQAAALAAEVTTDSSVELVWVPFDIWPGSLLALLPTSVRVRLGPRGRTAATEHLTADDMAVPATAHTPSPARTGPSGRLVLRVFWWSIATFAALSAGTSLRRRLQRVTAEVVVIDRYRLDTIVKLQSWYPTVSPAWIARIVLLLTPAPDVECLLRVSGAEAYHRKAEQYTVTQLTRQARLYDELVRLVPGVVVVDGEQDAEAVAAALRTRMRVALSAR